ncbi:reverse transcriptase domain-containing protein [Tanacetum coccineum]
MKLNPKECTFGAEEGMFMGHIVTTKGIKQMGITGNANLLRQSRIVDPINQQQSHGKVSAERLGEDPLPIGVLVEEEAPEPWTLFTDESSCQEGSNKVLKEKSINEKEIFVIVEKEGYTWMTLLLEYLMEGTLPGHLRTWGSSVRAHQADIIVKKFMKDPAACTYDKGDIVSNKGKQFAENPFRYWCEKLKIKERITFVMHPQTNRLVERANIGLGEGIKACLDKGSKDCLEEVPHEKRERVVVREAKSKAKMEKYYNSKVRITLFKPDDFVYRNNDASHVEDTGKLGPKWEGPYEVVEALGK